MATNPYVAVCWSCGWARVAYSHTKGIKRAKQHQHSGCQTDLIAESDVEALGKLKSKGEDPKLADENNPMPDQKVNTPELDDVKADAEQVSKDMRELFKKLNRL